MEHKLSTLEFSLRKRPYITSSGGAFQSERNYLDFVIDGHSLKDLVGYDVVSVLCREWASKEREKSVRRLLREEPADFPGDRRSLLVCAECGGLDCGAVSIAVDFSDTSVHWRDFGFQNDHEPKIQNARLKELGPFEFDSGDYRDKLVGALGMLS